MMGLAGADNAVSGFDGYKPLSDEAIVHVVLLAALFGHFNRMAVPTAIAFSLAAIGVLALRPHSGILAVALSDGPGGAMARGLLPAGFLAPALFGWIAIWGLRASDRQDQPALVVMLFVVAMILVFVGLIAWNATQLHRTHLDRVQTEAALRETQERFRLIAENVSDDAEDGMLDSTILLDHFRWTRPATQIPRKHLPPD